MFLIITRIYLGVNQRRSGDRQAGVRVCLYVFRV